MTLLRFIILAGFVVAVGVCAPTSAHAADAAATSSATLSSVAWGADSPETMKGDKPARPRPKPGPKDGGEDE